MNQQEAHLVNNTPINILGEAWLKERETYATLHMVKTLLHAGTKPERVIGIVDKFLDLQREVV